MKTDSTKSSYTNTHICYYCKEPIIGKRRDAKFCSAKCRQQNYLDNKEGLIFMRLAKEYFEIEISEPGKHDDDRIYLIYKVLNENDDPLSHHKYDLYLNYFRELEEVKSFIEQFYELEKRTSVNLADLSELIASMSEKMQELKNSNNKKTKFLIGLLNDIARFVRLKLSEMKLKSLTTTKFVIPETYQQTLFDYHAQIMEKLEVPEP